MIWRLAKSFLLVKILDKSPPPPTYTHFQKLCYMTVLPPVFRLDGSFKIKCSLSKFEKNVCCERWWGVRPPPSSRPSPMLRAWNTSCIYVYKLLQYSKCEFSTYVHMLCLLNRVYSSKVDADSLNMGARLRDYRDFSKRSPDDLHRHSRNQHYRKRQRGSKGHRENTQRLYPNRLLDY